MAPIGFAKRSSSGEYERDRSLVSRIVFKNEFAKGLDGIEERSHIYVIFWMDKILLKALIKIKAKNLEFELEELYNVDDTLFTKAKLLERLCN